MNEFQAGVALGLWIGIFGTINVLLFLDYIKD
jgi:hypothetical protein